MIRDIFSLGLVKGVLQDSVSVKFWFLNATTEEALPFLMQVKGVEIVAQILLAHLLEDCLDLAAFELVVDFDAVTDHSRVNFSRVFGRLWRVVFKVGNLVIMAESSKFFQEAYILDVDLAKLLL